MRIAFKIAGFLLPLLLLSQLSAVKAPAQSVEYLEKKIALDNISGGLLLMKRKAYDEAIDRFTKAITSGYLDKENLAIAFNNRGNAYADKKNQRAAEKDYTRALRLVPGFKQARFNRGIARYRLGEDKGSISDFSKVIESDPGFAGGWFNRSFPLARQGRYDEAIADVKKALSLRVDFPRYREHLSDLIMRAERAGKNNAASAGGKSKAPVKASDQTQSPPKRWKTK